jgi:hypothetical protein
MILPFVRRAALLTLFTMSACVTGRGSSGNGGLAGRDFGEVLAQAEVAAGDRRYAEADRLLADYAASNPGTRGAVESSYWRGVFLLEPENRDGSPLIAAALFETYNRSEGALPHRLEANILRHVAQRLQVQPAATVASTATVSASTGVTSSGDRSADLKAKDTEIQRLKDELAKANDELERIKRRLTTPTKP